MPDLAYILSKAAHPIDWMMGRTHVDIADVPPLQGQPYPDQSQVDAARASDASYGDPSAAFVQPAGGKIVNPRTRDQIQEAFNTLDDKGKIPLKPMPVSSTLSDNLAAAFLASRRSALAGLGFDPRHMTIGEAPRADWSLGGAYYPDADQILSTGVYPSTTVHESMHRGIEQLRQAGMLPPGVADMSEEAIVRGQMLRNFGDVELGRGTVGDQQIDDGRYYSTNPNFSPTMDAIEQAAAKLYAQRHPGGPR